MFEGWDDFYLLVGSASGALIGLLFVVVTLTTGRDRSRIQRGQELFMTPVVVHFAVVLSVSGLAMAPRVPVAWVAGLLIAAGVGGALYAGAVAWRIQHGTPDHWSDVWCYGCLPATFYLALALDGAWMRVATQPAVYALAPICLALMFISIRNAWDLVTWLAPRREEI